MKIINVLGYQLNGLEFVTYILIPISIILIILVFIFFNIEIIKLILYSDNNELNEENIIIYELEAEENILEKLRKNELKMRNKKNKK